MSTILFYGPFVKRARDVESVMIALKEKGHHIISLNLNCDTEFSNFVASQGISTHCHEIPGDGSILYLVKHVWAFIRFCRSNKVDFVFSHLDTTNFIASVAQYFVKARVFLCRHHVNEAALYKYSHSRTYVATNALVREMIVVSERARTYMHEIEGIALQRIRHINLGYNFRLYPLPSLNAAASIKRSFSGKIVMLTIGRLTQYKRPDVSVEIAQRLKQRGIDAVLLLLGDGPMRQQLEDEVSKNGLSDCVFFKGHVPNVLDFLEAADIVLHPSLLESSCVVIKEAGLLKKPVLLCKDVGDFNEYMIDGTNGFVADAENFANTAIEIISHKFWQNRPDIGENLHNTITRRFDIDNVLPQYLDLLSSNVRTATYNN
ncbi:glycosyltransferase family 4 protein [Chryseolinea sp. T2]|uniref:glycosyltransferase family 4 protein n=1 Tax=Chryseolinea sp. T2 TaxID=3129255 RepID=UPI003076D4E6